MALGEAGLCFFLYIWFSL